jgi:hypothetical protein
MDKYSIMAKITKNFTTDEMKCPCCDACEMDVNFMATDNVVTPSQVLIAMVYQVDGANAAFTAKCVLEYREQ